ncbi:MAG TPA: YIP1 family protein [Rhodobacteraceae bacterium]|nr:YIP1 family protein [Paracoccaceae bacterium]
MSVVLDIAEAYRRPASVFRRRLGVAPREDRALAILMAACLLVFVSAWPVMQRKAIETGEEFEMLIAGTLFVWLFLMPLLAYTLGTLSHGLARLVGGRGSGYSARFALFWALLVASPLWLLWGLTQGFVGPGVQEKLVGAVALGAFLVHWSLNLWTAERP